MALQTEEEQKVLWTSPSYCKLSRDESLFHSVNHFESFGKQTKQQQKIL